MRLIVIRKVQNYAMEKLYSSKTCLKMAGGYASPTSPQGPSLPSIHIDKNVSYHHANQLVWLQYDYDVANSVTAVLK